MYHIHISASEKNNGLKLNEVYEYRQLIGLFTKRTFKVSYAQTVLGPLWLFINPLFTSIVYVILFGNIARLSTDGLPQLLFYMAGNAIWGFFSQCVTNNASTFTSNAYLFGKVYFPRLTVPVSNVLSSGIRFGIQMILVLGLIIYYLSKGDIEIFPLRWLLIPVILIWLGIMGMGVGIIVSSMTTKYRDLSVLVSFGMSLWMYATPVVYPLSTLPEGILRDIIAYNPVTAPVELFRYAVLGTGTFEYISFAVSAAFTFVVAVLGILVFNRVERTFIDTV